MEAEVARRRAGLKAPYPTWATGTGLVAAALYLALLPFVERAWRVTGDEPHYLLAAHSLVTDRDMDLADNYDRLDYLAFYYSPDIKRQVRTDPAGRQLLNHAPGLPFLIAPAYLLAGRLGVLIFQVILGGLLAAVTFKLAALISQDRKAALLATLAVMLTPPLFMYTYLVYPEITGALLATSVLYLLASRERAAPGTVSLTALALVTLPWLNRRFVLLAIVLAALAVWRWGEASWFTPLDTRFTLLRATRGASRLYSTQKTNAPRRLWFQSALLPLLLTLLSTTLLFWFNSRLDAPARVDFVFTPEPAVLWRRLVRGIGWLLDQQRGLFIFSPVYILAAWGLPPLLAASRDRGRPDWLALAPFGLAWGMTTLAAGFWVAWELGPRFLVVGLPGLAPLLALAWRRYGRFTAWRVLAVLLFSASLANSALIIRDPELVYKSSLPLFYGQKSGLPLTELLPDLAGYLTVPAAGDGPETARFAPAGERTTLIDSGPLTELPFGHYRLTWPVRLEAGLPAETDVMELSIKTLGGGQLFRQVVAAAELPDDGRYGQLRYAFTNTNADRWRTPPIFQAVTTGRAGIWAGEAHFTPDPLYAWLLPYAYLGLVAAGAWLAWRRSARLERKAVRAGPGRMYAGPGLFAAWAALALPLLAALGYVSYQIARPDRVYEAGQFQHLAGRPVADAAAGDGWAWLADPAVDPPQKAIYGPFDFYEPGLYQVRFRLKLPEPVETAQAVARLEVSATDRFESLVAQPLLPAHFSNTDHYHDFILTVTNPRRQALSFEVHYLGLAPLLIDRVTVNVLEEEPF